MPEKDDWLKRERERVRSWRALRSATGRDIGRLPAIVDPQLKAACRLDLELFCINVLPGTFTKRFSPDHLEAIESLEKCILTGGLLALAMPRGHGKTSLVIAASLWAALYGHRTFIVILGATGKAAQRMLDTIKVELTTNDALLALFPEVAFPIRCMEGINNRAAGQRYAGQATYIGWKKSELMLPTISDSPASGVVIQVSGLLGSFRGAQVKTPDGLTVRPDLVLLDDPQTDQSARNPTQCEKREGIIQGAVLGLAGPDEKIACVMPCTVIEPNDLSDRMLNRNLYPEWHGFRTKLLYDWPKNMEHWDHYAELRADGMRMGDDGAAATDYYEANREAMDEGARPSWEERFDETEISAVQHAMNLYYRSARSFAAEMQNEPLSRTAGQDVVMLTAGEIMEKLDNVPRGTLPTFASVLTAFVDVQQDVLFWMVAGWSQGFDGAIVDYGSWPDQQRPYYSLADLGYRMTDLLEGGLEERIYEGLGECVKELFNREFTRADETKMKIGRLMIDANWQTNVVKKFCRFSPFAASLLPAHGRYVGATTQPITAYKPKEGERRGEEWLIGRAAQERGMRHVIFDTNYWKSFVHARLVTKPGGHGSLFLPGSRPIEHRMIADHLVSEKPTIVEAKGRKVAEWILPPGEENHFLDTLVGTAVAASIEGCQLLGHKQSFHGQPRQRGRSRVSYLT